MKNLKDMSKHDQVVYGIAKKELEEGAESITIGDRVVDRIDICWLLKKLFPKKMIHTYFAFLIVFMLSGVAMAQNTQVNLGWDANAESDLAGYKIYRGVTTGVYDGVFDAGNVITYPLVLSDGTHYLAVTAYDTSGNESDYSAELVLVTDATKPAPATGFKEVSRVITTTTTTTTIFLPIP